MQHNAPMLNILFLFRDSIQNHLEMVSSPAEYNASVVM